MSEQNRLDGDYDGTVLCDTIAQLGEGPTYDPANGTAWWFDILGCKLFELKLETQALTGHDLPFMASVLAVVDNERQIIAHEQGLCLRNRKTGVMSSYISIEADNSATRSNDGRVHQSGALWVGTMGNGEQQDTGAGAIYHVLRGDVRKLYANITCPNAICFSPDGGTAYFTDSAVNKLMRVAVDPATGIPTGEPSVLIDHSEADSTIDGAICDADGLIWNARWNGSEVHVFTPEGERVQRYRLPASRITCPAFIGKDASQVLVTSAYKQLTDAERAEQPLAGATFLLDATAKGRFEPKMVI